jgi:hypothetical protein
MFMDWTWMGKPADAQEHELERWLRKLASTKARLAVVELGAGVALRAGALAALTAIDARLGCLT